MAIRVVRLGGPRHPGEGLRIGTVRRPPRGVPKTRFGSDNWYDIWLPDLAPSATPVRQGLSAGSDRAWNKFATRYAREMAAPQPQRILALLAALSHHGDFSVGCYCVDESRCHRSVLRRLLAEHGAKLT